MSGKGTRKKPIDHGAAVIVAAHEVAQEVLFQNNTVDATPQDVEVVSREDHAVAFIRDQVARARQQAMAAMIEIGRFIVDDYFEGDRESLRSRSPVKGKSLRLLAARLDGDMDEQALWRAVKLYLNADVLVPAVRDQLSPTHVVRLLRAPDDKREELAEAAVKNHWTAQKVAEEVRKALASRPDAQATDLETTTTADSDPVAAEDGTEDVEIAVTAVMESVPPFEGPPLDGFGHLEAVEEWLMPYLMEDGSESEFTAEGQAFLNEADNGQRLYESVIRLYPVFKALLGMIPLRCEAKAPGTTAQLG